MRLPTSDSREVEKGSHFYAICGFSHDGHKNVAEVIQKGAEKVFVERLEIHQKYPETILVSSTRKAYAEALSKAFDFPSQKIKLIGITGTNGKTTTSFLLTQTLKQLGNKTTLIGTVQTEIGNKILSSELTTPGPKELQNIFAMSVQEKVQYGVMEVSSIALDQYRTWSTQFEVGVFTNLTQDHLDYHLTMENYAEAKRKFFTDYGLKHSIFNLDDPQGKKWFDWLPNHKVGFSLLNKADYYFSDIKVEKHQTRAKLNSPKGVFDFATSLIGNYNLSNCLAAIATADCMNLSLQDFLFALEKAQGAPGRLERVMIGENYPLIYVDYAHSPDALLKVLLELNKFKEKFGGKVITVVGCGGDRDKSKRPKMGAIASQYSDIAIITSDNPRTEDPGKIISEILEGVNGRAFPEVDRKKAIFNALEKATPHDIVLIAGKGHETYQIIGKEKISFDDREIVKNFYYHN